MKNLNESKHGFWGVLARKAKAILDEDTLPQEHVETPQRKRSPMPATPTMGKVSYFGNAKILALGAQLM